LALLGANSRFLTVNAEDETVECARQKATEAEMLKIRSSGEREEDKELFVPEEERGKIGQIELNYVKKFQKFQNHKTLLNNEDRNVLVDAKKGGNLHETLLDRRAKMKADRYCK
jgi:protein FRG1